MRKVLFLISFGIMVFAVTWALSVVVASEQQQKALDVDYHSGIVYNFLERTGLPDDTISYIMSLPSTPEIDLQTLMPITKDYLFISDDFLLAVQFKVVRVDDNLYQVKHVVRYDMRRKK